jgi:hypothetical protein
VLEPLETRTVPSLSVLGIPAPELSAPPAFKPQPLMIAPVTTDSGGNSPMTQVLGNPQPLLVTAPVPEFLVPAPPVTVATSMTGPLVISNFAVNNDKLGQMTNDLQVPDTLPASPATPMGPSQTEQAPGPGTVQFVVAPVRVEWQGLRIESSSIQVTATVDHLGGSLLTRVEEILSTVAQTLAHVITLVAAKLVAAAEYLVSLLPSWCYQALGRLAPPTPVTVHLAHYQFGPVNASYEATWPAGSGLSAGTGLQSGSDQQIAVDTTHTIEGLPAVEGSPVLGTVVAIGASGEQGESVSVSKVTVDVFADTGPDKPVGNVLVDATRHEKKSAGADAGQSGSSDGLLPGLTDTSPAATAKAVMHDAFGDGQSSGSPGAPGMGAMNANSEGSGLPPGPGGGGPGNPGGNAGNDGAPPPIAPVGVQSATLPVIVMTGSGGSGHAERPPTLLPKPPPKDPADGGSENQDTLLDDDSPLPQVLPEIGLPDDNVPLRQILPEDELPEEVALPVPQATRVALAFYISPGSPGAVSTEPIGISISLPQGQPQAPRLTLTTPAGGARVDGLVGRGSSHALARVQTCALHGASSWYANLVDQSCSVDALVSLDNLCTHPITGPEDGSQDGPRWDEVVGAALSPAFAVIISPLCHPPPGGGSRDERKRRNGGVLIVIQLRALDRHVFRWPILIASRPARWQSVVVCPPLHVPDRI